MSKLNKVIKKIKLILLTAIITFVLFLTIIEIFSRIVYSPTLFIEDTLQKNGLVVRNDDPIIFYKNKPSYSYESALTSYVHNSKGFRNEEEFDYIKPQNTFRIIVLGDSVAYGDDVDQKDTFSYVVQKMLEESNEDKNYQVMNAGVGGYNTYQEVYWFKKEGIKYDPDMVIVAFTFNDIEEVLNYENSTHIYLTSVKIPPIPIIININKKVNLFLSKNSRAYQLINLGTYKLFNMNPENVEFYDTSLIDAIDSIKELKKISLDEDIDLLFVIFPGFFDTQPIGNDIIINELDKENITTLVLLEDYSSIGFDKIKIIDYDTTHPNKLGNRIAAEKIFSYIKD